MGTTFFNSFIMNASWISDRISHARLRSIFLPLLIVFVLAGFPRVAVAGTLYNESIRALRSSNTVIIASDASRNAILVSGSVQFTPKTGTFFPFATYRLGVALQTSTGTGVALENGVDFDISLGNRKSVVFIGDPLGILGSTTTPITNFAIRPSQPLSVNQTYKVLLVVAERTSLNPDVYVTRTSALEPTAKQYWTWTSANGSDAGYNVLASFTSLEATPAPERLVAIRSVPGKEGFRIAVAAVARRYDAFDLPLPIPPPSDGVYFPANVAVRFQAVLTDTTLGTTVALANGGEIVVEETMGAFTLSGSTRIPVRKMINQMISIIPVSSADIQPNRTYSLSVTLRHTEPGMVVVSHGTKTTSGLKLISLSGKLRFGGVLTELNSVTGNPASGLIFAQGGGNFLMPLTIPTNGGAVSGRPEQVFSGGPLLVLYSGSAGPSQGDLSLAAGSQTVQLLAGGGGSSSNIRWTRGPVVLSITGAQAQNFRVYLPAGLGISAQDGGRQMGSVLVNVPLTPGLEPTGVVSIQLNPSSNSFYLSHERLPFRCIVRTLKWFIQDGRFEPEGSLGDGSFIVSHFRSDERHLLRNAWFLNNLADGDDGNRMSNDWFLGDSATIRNFVVRASADGRALLDVDFVSAPTTYRSHFPKGLAIPGGQTVLSFRNSEITTGTMTQTGSAPLTMSYNTVARDSPSCVTSMTGQASRNLSFSVAGGIWNVTRDGGLRAPVTLASQDIPWGARPVSNQFVHTVKSVTAGSVLVAGIGLSRSAHADIPGAGGVYLPSAMLLAGFGSPGNPALIERYGTAGYDPALSPTEAGMSAAGLADYPGLNIRSGTDGGLNAESYIADNPVGPYRLKGYSKYYVRSSGVSGVHDAVTADVLPLPKVYGYDMTLDRLSLAYLDNVNTDSLNAGSVELPFPSDFTLAFKKLLFTSTGELRTAELANPGEKTLAYWNLKVRPGSMNFPAVNECAAGPPYPILTLGMTGLMPAITPAPLQGRLGFFPSGELANLTNSGEARLDSRFTLPAVIDLEGVDGGRYTLTTVNRAALNNHALPGKPDVGFVSFAGAMGVPFFEDIPVHLHATASATGTPTSLYHVMGGWTVGEKNFFNDPDFDAENKGYPGGSLTDYRANTNAITQPVAKRNWRGIVDLNYPLIWSSAGRSFTSRNDTDTLMIIEVDHQLQSLTSEGCAITFGAGFETPRFSLAKLAAEGLTAGLKNALPDPDGLLNGMERLNELLTDRFERTIGPSLQPVLDSSASGIVDQLRMSYNSPGSTGFSGLTPSVFSASSANITAQIKTLGGDGGDLLGKINDAIDAAEHACDLGLALVGTENSRGTLIQAISELSRLAGSGPTTATAQVMANSEDGLRQAERILREAKRRISELRGKADIAQQIEQAVNREAAAATSAAINEVISTFKAEHDITGRYMDEFTDAQLKAKVIAILKRKISGGALASAVQPVLRGALDEVRTQFRGSIDLVFAEMNRILNRTLEGAVQAGLDGATDEFKKMAGSGAGAGQAAAGVGDYGAAARINGYASIDGEEIEEIRLDARLQMKVGGTLEVDAFFRLLNTDSDTPNTSCRPPGAVATEVTLGAHAKADFGPSVGFDVSMEGKFSFNDENQLTGLDGTFDLRAEMPVKQASFDRFAAKFGFGSGVAYIAGLVEGKVYFVEAEGRCFFGTTRNPLDLIYIDKQSRKVISGHSTDLDDNGCLVSPLTGFYTGLDGSASVNEFFGILDSCMLSIHLDLGVGNFCFFQSKGGEDFLIPGVRYKVGATGTVLCLVSMSGYGDVAAGVEIPVSNIEEALSRPGKFLSQLADAEAIGYGSLHLEATIGVPPLAVKPSATVSLYMTLSRDDVDVSFDAKED